MNTKTLNTDIDSLLDGTLDDLADMPEFKPFPVGTHKVKVGLEIKDVDSQGKKCKAVELTLTAIETVELAAGSEEPPLSPGDSTNLLYFLTHPNPKTAELGQGQFKELMKSMAEHFGAKSNRELIEEANGAECLVVTGKRFKDKGKPEQKVYTTVEALTVC